MIHGKARLTEERREEAVESYLVISEEAVEELSVNSCVCL